MVEIIIWALAAYAVLAVLAFLIASWANSVDGTGRPIRSTSVDIGIAAS